MAKADIDANLFRLVHTVVGKDWTRYYLNGVSVEPHPEEGVLLVATDGHRLLVAHDLEGTCDEKIIVKFPAYALAQCKAPAGKKRRIAIDAGTGAEGAGSARIFEFTPAKHEGDIPKYEDVMEVYSVIIDGTFPDWRRLMPTEKPLGSIEPVGFNSRYLKDFAVLGRDIAKTIGGSGAFILHQNGSMNPTVVRWSGAKTIFGIIMAMNFDERGAFIPDFVKQPFPQAAE